MKSQKIIIRFDQVCDQNNGVIKRYIGFVQAKYLIDLIEIANLDANPRSSKVGSVTDDIIESIEKTTDIFPFKTKGILVSVSKPPKELERKRFEFEFEDNQFDGILDGGHNTLAIAIYILYKAVEDHKAIRKIKRWQDLEERWIDYKDEVQKIKDTLDFLVPIEILVPNDQTEEVVEQFKKSILDICAARNNNVQLTVDTKANAAGHYEIIKDVVDPTLEKEIIWKTNTEGRIPVRDLVALTWVPLLELELEGKVPTISPVQLYSSKAKCMQNFVKLMESPDVSTEKEGRYTLKNSQVESALKMLEDMPKLYDLIYELFPGAYNKHGGKFGRINAVKEKQKSQPKTPFYYREVDMSVPEGFIVPLIYGTSALITSKNGRLAWKEDPEKFIRKNISNIIANYKTLLEAFNFDPQKVGKNSGSYTLAKQQFEFCLLQNQ